MEPKRFWLRRDKPEDERTRGTLVYLPSGLEIMKTMEPGLLDTAHPRIGAGFKICWPHGWDPDSDLRFKRTWAVVGAETSRQKTFGVPRCACLFHDGTRDEHTEGCILCGSFWGESKGEPGLLEKIQGEAIERLRDLVGKEIFYLTITEPRE